MFHIFLWTDMILGKYIVKMAIILEKAKYFIIHAGKRSALSKHWWNECDWSRLQLPVVMKRGLAEPPPPTPYSGSHLVSLCRYATLHPGQPSPDRPSQPTQSLGRRSTSSKRLQAAGLVWGPTFCRQAPASPTNNHKEPCVLGGRGEVRRNRRSIHKNTLPPVRLDAAYRERSCADSD